jgi:hypothetical protein
MTAAQQIAPRELAGALDRVDADALLVVDFDETLFLRNSTEMFLDAARPAVLAATIGRLVEFLKPWRLSARYRDGFAMADWLRVLCVVCLMPWILWRWRQLAPALAKAHLNPELATLLATGRFRRIVVASHGFAFIIMPLLSAMPIRAELVASPLWFGFLARAKGKRALLEARYGAAAVAAATVVTDHARHDADILEAVAHPLVVAWPEARYERAFARTYVPLVYTERAKHPTHLHLLGVFFGKDWMVLVLASALLAPNPLLAALGLAFLIVSYAIVYEVGYHENDHLGSRRERKPILTAERLALAGTVDERQAWLFGTLVGLPGAAVLAWSGASVWHQGGDLLEGTALLLGLWLALLVVIRATFWLFNRIDERSRLFLHLPLQLMKGLWLVWVLGLPLSAAGAALLLANSMCAWIPYAIYRMGGARWQTPDNVIRLLICLVLLSATMAVGDAAALLEWQVLAVLGWAVYKARKELVKLSREVHLLPDLAPADAPGDGRAAGRALVAGGLAMAGAAAPQRGRHPAVDD